MVLAGCFLQAGIVLCCLGLAIFGITEVPTEGVDFDTGDFVVDGSAESAESTAGPTAGTYAPPPSDKSKETTNSGLTDPDPELGGQEVSQQPLPNDPAPLQSLVGQTNQPDMCPKEEQGQPSSPAELHDLD